MSENLGSIAALDNQATVYFRLTMLDTTAAGTGSTLGTAGTDRVDNFTVSASPVPLPAAIWLLGSGLSGLLGFARLRGRRANV